jgi:hypothetical protein
VPVKPLPANIDRSFNEVGVVFKIDAGGLLSIDATHTKLGVTSATQIQVIVSDYFLLKPFI